MIEVLTDTAEDRGYNINDLETSDPVLIYVGQIKMAFETGFGDIMNSEGTIDLEELVYEQNLDQAALEQRIRSMLGRFCSFYNDFETEIEVFFSKGNLRDACIIAITIDKDYDYKVAIK